MLPYQNSKLSPEQRTIDLLARMTVEEKIGQLIKLDGFRSYKMENGELVVLDSWKDFMERYPAGTMSVLLRADWWTGINWSNGITPERVREAVMTFQRLTLEKSRLGIPLYIMEEASHGLMALGTTVFPTGIGLGSMWDAELMERIGKTVGRETAAAGVQATHGPVLDVIGDVRWSRVEENYSEDPFLTTVYAENYVRGLRSEKTEPTLKHFCGHGSSEGGHNSAPVHAGPIEMFNMQLRPFRAAIAAGAHSVMSSYNCVDGIPVTGSHYYLTEVLRNKFKFDGFVVSDRGAIPRLKYQRVCLDDTQCSVLAVKAGCDVDNGRWDFHAENLKKAMDQGMLSMEDLDCAVGHVLKRKFQMGLFENPFPGGNPVEVYRCKEHCETALEASRKSLVLLKNNGILPLKPGKKLAVIGPNADNPMNQLGDYSAPQREGDVVTPLAGLRSLAEKWNLEIAYSAGCRIRKTDRSLFAEALKIAEESDIILFFPGGSSTKYGTGMTRTVTGAAISEVLSPEESEKESGEGTDRATLNYSGVQLELFTELLKTGKPIVVVPIQGRPLLMNEFTEHADAILLAWYPGMFGGQAIAEALLGEYNPSGRLPVSLPRTEGQLPVNYNALEKRPDYVDLTSSPLYPFGYGMSYTEFSYDDFRMEDQTLFVKVTNTGKVTGEDVVQFYQTALDAPIQRPYLELIGFQRIQLAPGESGTVSLKLTEDLLGCYDRNGDFTFSGGYYDFHVGKDCEHLTTLSTVRISKEI